MWLFLVFSTTVFGDITAKLANSICGTQSLSQFQPHPHDCSVFFVCAHLNSFQLNCPAGLHFDTKINVCNYPQKAGCKLQQNEQEAIAAIAEGTPVWSTNFGGRKKDFPPKI